MTQFFFKKLLKSILTGPVNDTQDPHKKTQQPTQTQTQTRCYPN